MSISKGSIKRANSSQSSKPKIQSSLNQTFNTSSILEIKNLVSVPKKWIFYKYSSGALTSIKKSIKKYGLIQPIVVRKLDNDTFQILDGYLRVSAYKKLELSNIKCEILENITDKIAKEIFEELHQYNYTHINTEISDAKFKMISFPKGDLPEHLL